MDKFTAKILFLAALVMFALMFIAAEWTTYTNMGAGEIADADTFLVLDNDEDAINEISWQLMKADFALPNGTDPDADAAGELRHDTDGANETSDQIIRAYDGTNQWPVGKKIECFDFTLIEPDTMDAVDLIPIWLNTSGMTFTLTEWHAFSDDDDVTLVLNEVTDRTDFTAITKVDDVEIATNGTSVFYASAVAATMDHTTIEHDHLIVIDFDATDTPDYVKLTICGWFNADID